MYYDISVFKLFIAARKLFPLPSAFFMMSLGGTLDRTGLEDSLVAIELVVMISTNGS
jgi:hypothetical protein